VFFRDGLEGEGQRPSLSPFARVPEKSLPVHEEEQKRIKRMKAGS